MPKLYIYGDSHGRESLRGIENSVNKSQSSITMFRIGRDKLIINFSPSDLVDGDVFIFVYGEVDCRCHVGKQVQLGRSEDEVIVSLVRSYIETIHSTIPNSKKVVVLGVIPPVHQLEHEAIHGPITHEFPFVGTDEDRHRYTQRVNQELEKVCSEFGYQYVYPYGPYTDQYGFLIRKLSDNNCHIGPNEAILEHMRRFLA